VQPLSSDPVECCVVKDNHTVGILGKSLQGEDGVVWLNDHIRHFIQVREHRIRLDQLLRESDEN